MSNAQYTVDDYTVAWVCALPLEMAAVKGMLDQIHPNLREQAASDHNCYLLGHVQGHNVVVACLPAGIYGPTSAATVAKDLLRTFKSVRFGLMVGIDGGAPSSDHDILLGDIVVSQPSGTTGGVIQYARGKTGREEHFERTGTLNTPPQVLLTALARLQTEHITGENRIPEFISGLIAKYPKMKGFTYRGESNDCLFHTEYEHVSANLDCEQCDRAHAILRDARDDTHPVTHYGNIASGDQLIKNATMRNRISKELGVLCFEMEAAGLMQDFPCLVVRGICDYADAHKNNAWQEYGAAVAAAFAKELLSFIPADRVLQEKPVPQLVSDPKLQQLLSNANTAIVEQTQKHEIRYENERQIECHRAFKTSKYEEFKNINPDRIPGTCKWVLEHPQYMQWCQGGHDDLLWISADPGCGKSVLARSLIHGELGGTSEHTVCYFFFKDNEEQDSLATALCAVLHQLPSIRLAGEESNADISEEINLVIQQKIQTAGDRLHPEQEVRDALQARLLATPQRTYLWLHLVWDELNNSSKRTKKAFLKKIDSLPSTVEEAYEKILTRHGSGQRQEAETLLHIVVGARRALTLREMDVVFQLATESPDVDRHRDLDLDGDHLKSRIRELCGLFVFISDNRIYLIHQTAKEFLVRREGVKHSATTCWRHSLPPRSSNKIMMEICVQYLSFLDIQDDRFRQRRKVNDSLNDFPLLEVMKLYDAKNERFHTWASIFWGTTIWYMIKPIPMPLHLAALNGQEKVVAKLIEIDHIDMKDEDGGTALWWAISEGNLMMVKLLLEKGADPNAQGKYGSALQTATAIERGSDDVAQLLEKGADPNAKSEYSSALQTAVGRGLNDIAQLLQEKGADPNARSKYSSALQTAVERGSNDIAQLLLEKGADPNAKSEYNSAL
ncbi:putative ankyrin repeat protein like [Verticillium longisporum]|nr:putative ankyrin repeat protein like [Verticillium longisporum]